MCPSATANTGSPDLSKLDRAASEWRHAAAICSEVHVQVVFEFALVRPNEPKRRQPEGFKEPFHLTKC